MGFSSLKLGQIVFCLLAGLVVLSSSAFAQTTPAQVVQQAGELKLNIPIARTMAGGQTEIFTVPCEAGDFLHVVADQQGLDVAVTILDPTGKPLMTADSPNDTVGPEPASTFCQTAATYSVAVSSSPGAAAGKYVLRLLELRPAQPHDKLEHQAEVDLAAYGPLSGADLASRQKAIALLNKDATEWAELHNDYEEALCLTGAGTLSNSLGDLAGGGAFFEGSLAVYRHANDRAGEASALNNLAVSQVNLGELQNALKTYREGLELAKAMNSPQQQAQMLHGIGTLYRELGQPQMALDLLNQSLSIRRETGDLNGQVYTLSNIGSVYEELGQYQRAMDYYNQAVPIAEALNNRTGNAYNNVYTVTLSGALTNLARSYQKLGQPQKALEFYGRSLEIANRAGNRAVIANDLSSMGQLYSALNQNQKAETAELTSLALARSMKDLALEGDANYILMTIFQHEQKASVATLFGIDSINAYQQIRRNISGLDKELQSSFTQMRSPAYRSLAELLVAQNRLAEAEHVLDLLKDAELKDTVRGAGSDSSALLPLSAADRAAEASIAAEANAASSLTVASFEFDRLNALTAPTEADKAKLKELSDKIAAGNTAIDTFFNKTLYAELGGDSKANARVDAVSTETSSLMNMLADLGPGTLALYTLVGDSHSYIIVTTANTRTRYELHTNAADLGKLVLSLRQELRTPSSDPSKDLEALSHILLDPMAADLAASAKQAPDHVPTLLWSLDGVLRYVPMNALFDGKQYLVEHAHNVVISPESRNHLLDPVATSGLKAVAFGVSQSYNGLPALKGVTAELDSIVHDPTVAASHGPLDGKLLDNDAFTLTALESSLKQRFPIVHIASHFAFRAGTDGDSYLLLAGQETGGKGYELTMTQFQTDPQLSFRGTRLLTLSACSTAQADTIANGREIDSLGMVMQKRDAAAVLATLWDVNDASTSLLMSDFYRRWAAHPEAGKGEALREAQLSMLHGQAAGQTQTTSRGVTVESSPGAKSFSNYSHPYYWAPFTLIGNFR